MSPLCLEMRDLILEHISADENLLVLNVGSKDNLDNCPYFKDLFFDTNWEWLGLDLEEGIDVDIVSHPYSYPFKNNTFDALVSNQVMEHVEYPWLWFKELARILKPKGKLIISTTWRFKIHRHPVDCWRTLPDGMKAIFKYFGFTTEVCKITGDWIYGVGRLS